MKAEEIYKLAQQGNPRAIAEILNVKLREQGIRVMAQQPVAQHLEIIFEGATTPDKTIIQKHLQSLQVDWQKHLTVTITAVGYRLGEIEPDWQWAIAGGVLSSEDCQQSPDSFAPIQKTAEAEQQRQDISLQLQKILSPYLWHSQVSQMNKALVIKLNVLEKIDRRNCRQVIYDAVKSLDAEEISQIYLNVYHRPTDKYLWKEVFTTNAPLELQQPTFQQKPFIPVLRKNRHSPSPKVMQGLRIIGRVLWHLFVPVCKAIVWCVVVVIRGK